MLKPRPADEKRSFLQPVYRKTEFMGAVLPLLALRAFVETARHGNLGSCRDKGKIHSFGM
ncbi:hypothetical protein FA194_09465 [Pseudomonas aeruginosa]|nr:hypothetical protein [Pseudomonas aeruginosa]